MESFGQTYPATLEVDRAERIANWRPLVQWLLVIPHFLILYGLQLVARAVAVISWFAILFTGRLPEGLANMMCLYIRYNNRAGAYAGFLREEYPPFVSTPSPQTPAATRPCAPGSRPSSRTATASPSASGSSWPSPT